MKKTMEQTMDIISVLTKDEQQLLKDAMEYGDCGRVVSWFVCDDEKERKFKANEYRMKDAVKAHHFNENEVMELAKSIEKKMNGFKGECRGIVVSYEHSDDNEVGYGLVILVKEDYLDSLVRWKDGIKEPSIRIENTKECAEEWVKRGYPCSYRYGYRWKGATSSRISTEKAKELLPSYSFGMGFCTLIFRNENGIDVLEFNELGENDLY